MFILTSRTLPPAAATAFSMHRGELLAGAAPRRPEIDQHRLLHRFVDDVLAEGLGGGVLDEVVAGGSAAGSIGEHAWPRTCRLGESRSGAQMGLGSPFLQFRIGRSAGKPHDPRLVPGAAQEDEEILARDARSSWC